MPEHGSGVPGQWLSRHWSEDAGIRVGAFNERLTPDRFRVATAEALPVDLSRRQLEIGYSGVSLVRVDWTGRRIRAECRDGRCATSVVAYKYTLAALSEIRVMTGVHEALLVAGG